VQSLACRNHFRAPDLDGDGFVNFVDLAIMKSFLFDRPARPH
jgi:hypothetical protein